MRGNLTIHLLEFCRPAALITQLVGSHVARTHPASRFDRNNFESRLSERKRRHATSGARADDHDVCLFEVGGHFGLVFDHKGDPEP